MTSNHNDFTVLLIDDDPMTLDSLSELVDANGYRVLTANGSAECIAKVSNGAHPNLIITDYRARNINGIETVKRLRKFLNENIPAIIFTDDTSEKVREAARKNNCIFIHKIQESNNIIYKIEEMVA